MGKTGITLDAAGYFRRKGRPVMPVGVNYWPAASGVDMWQAWDEDELRHDLDVVRGLGLNVIRFFLRWPDFEPELGRYDDRMFERLGRLTGWCAERGLMAHPSLIVGFMSGGFFWPQGRGSRNLYVDPLMVERSAAFCRRAAAALAPFDDAILALDLGNELSCVDAWGAPPAAIRAWCATVTAAIREAYPAARIVSGLDSQPVFNDCGWRLGDQPGTDFASVHTYPVPAWNPVAGDGMTDPFTQAILPFNTLVARAFGPVMVQEFSSILVAGGPECASYLGGVLPACLEHGCNGFLWWCLRDVRAPLHPYVKTAFEGRLGLVDAQDRVKPELEPLMAFFRSLREWTPSAPASDVEAVGLYWPQEFYRRDNPFNPGNDPTPLYRRQLAWYYMLRRLGRPVRIVRGDHPLDAATPRTLVIAGAALTTTESDAVARWVGAGGRLLWSGPAWAQWTRTMDGLLGAAPVDMTPPRPLMVSAFGGPWTLPVFPAEGRTIVRPTTARVLASSAGGEPVVLANAHGRGRVVAVLPLAEEGMLAVTADRAARDAWQPWFAGLLGMAERG